MLEVCNLKVNIDTGEGIVKAVDGVSFSVSAGETIGIVGESGSGKSVLAQSILRLNLEPPVFYPEGEIWFENKNILTLNEKKIRKLRRNDISMIFQDPMSSLNPVLTIGFQLVEAIRVREKISKNNAKKKAIELLHDVGISDPERRIREYPHQLSGGMRQRILIAIALASKPKLLIADEPTTALDVTIQAQILDVLKHIQQKYNMAIIMITHDLGVIAHLADRVFVMYSGRIVEEGSANDIFYETAMPYTWSLLRSIPRLDDGKGKRLIPINGQPPNLLNPPKGCNFYGRCPFATEQCLHVDPLLIERENGHKAACVLSKEEFLQLTSNIDSEKSTQKGVAL